MQKALFADERVKKMSENPGNQAFLRTLEDQVSDDDMDLIDVVEDPQSESSQSQSQEREQGQEKEQEQGERKDGVLVPNSQPTTDRPPAHMRRTKNGKKPSNIGEIRESLSSLLDEPEGSFVAPTELGSDSEDEASRDKENVGPRNSAVKDRISLGRASGSSAGGRRAFAGSSQGVRAPTLLRRATSNSLVSNLNETSGSKGGAGGDMFGEKIRKGAGRGTGAFGGAATGGGVGKAESAGDAKRRERRMRGAEERLRAARGLFGGVAFE